MVLDETAATVTWAYMFYLGVHTPEGADGGVRSPLQAPSTRVRTQLASRRFCPDLEEGLRSCPSLPSCSQASPSYLLVGAHCGRLPSPPSMSTMGWPPGAQDGHLRVTWLVLVCGLSGVGTI